MQQCLEFYTEKAASKVENGNAATCQFFFANETGRPRIAKTFAGRGIFLAFRYKQLLSLATDT